MGATWRQTNAEREQNEKSGDSRQRRERAFNAFGKRIQSVKEFRYLGRILTSTDDGWPAVARNLQKARATWGRLARILGREGADPKVSRNFYIAVWIPVESLDDSTREGRTTAAPLGPPVDWGAQEIKNEFPKGKQTAVPGGGMPGGV